jgi:hypothetical protein
MPLKHDTETWLVLLLGALTVVAGIVCMFLPPVSVALWPWAVAFVISLIYPLALYPYLKERRADNAFRFLHFAPAAIFLLWLFADLAAGASGSLAPVQQWLTWNGGFLPVAAVLLLLVLFCLSVIRQRQSRLMALGLLLLLLIAFGVLNGRYHWDSMLAAKLWGHSGSLMIAGDATMTGATTSAAETRWRAQLRLMEERRRALEDGTGAIAHDPDVQGSRSGSVIAGGMTSSVGPSTPPPRLPPAGPTADVLIFLTMSGFTGALHRRSMRRSAS